MNDVAPSRRRDLWTGALLGIAAVLGPPGLVLLAAFAAEPLSGDAFNALLVGCLIVWACALVGVPVWAARRGRKAVIPAFFAAVGVTLLVAVAGCFAAVFATLGS